MSDKQNFAKSATLGVAGTKHHGVELSDVLYEHPKTLKPHPENATLFQEQDDLYFNRLRDDVRERGILVPLQVKPDKTLLAGHNRLRVALELGLERVPVQYVEDALSPEQEREFLIKDNLLRRHLSGQECIELYRKMYPNFDERIREKVVGRKAQTEEPATQPEEQQPLTAREIAAATGQKERTVQHQLKKHREATNGTSETPREREQKGKSAFSTLTDANQRFSRAIDEIYAAINAPGFSTWIPLETLAKTLTKKYQAQVLKQDEGEIFSAVFVRELEFHFVRLYNQLRSWEETTPSSEQQNEVYSALQKKLDEFQERLTMRQEVEHG